jgi:hypothetical protein
MRTSLALKSCDLTGCSPCCNVLVMANTSETVTESVNFQGGVVPTAIVGLRCPECSGPAYVTRLGGVGELHSFECSMPDFR